MGDLFRSEEMALAQLFIQPEASYYSVSELGEIGIVQFRDLNQDVNLFQRKFVNEVRRCDDMVRQLRYIESELKKDEVAIPDCTEIPKAPNPREIIDLEAHLQKTEGDIKELSESAVSLKMHYLELTELKYVLEKTKQFFNEQEGTSSFDRALIPEDLLNAGGGTVQLAFVAGVVNRDRIPAFERMLWRVSRGNVFVRQADIETKLEDPVTGFNVNKTVFAAFFQGDQLKSRIKKICAGFRASLYACPSTANERAELESGVYTRLEDLKLVLNQTQDHRQRVLVNVAKKLQNWSVMVRKMKAIYHTLNMFNMDVSNRCLIGECWLPISDRDRVQQALTDGSNLSGSSIPSFLNIINTTANPPTFNRTNKFTKGFQNLIDAYGIASYREVNPALYTIITFPFLFAVMFGDIGHAIILIFFAIALISMEKKVENMKNSGEGDAFFLIYGGRYIILLMGIFSIYTGFLYNDLFAKPIKIFSSSWYSNYNESTILENKLLQLNPDENYDGTPYPIGVDPVWQFAENKIIFLNSFKMKMSIIFGVIHMMFGVCVSVVNHIYFKRYINIIFDFIPQILFLMLLFLWMVVMMFIKWVLYGPNKGEIFGPFCAPSVLIYFINMILFNKAAEPEEGCEGYMFPGQNEVQLCFLIVAVLCIPVMLFGKPLYIIYTKPNKTKADERKGNVNHGMELQSTDMEKPKPAASSDHSSDDLPNSELFIGQAIHTIEYVLSTVSHTASYLRLWALSLAHAQLSHVLWQMVMSMGLSGQNFSGAIMIYLIFYAWSFLTVFILVVMEGMSAFLHTLRLHWVEFMTKFYEGMGYPFQPFSFNVILMVTDDSAE